jgi:two-component system phosphate regulon response regulator PhoB
MTEEATADQPVVVIADDEVHIVDVLAFLFESYDVLVVKAYNGEQALQAVEEYVPRLVIADFMMPKLNGPELFRRLRAAPATASIPVILMSALPAYALPPAAADGYLPKPFDLDRVEAYADKYFSRR